jgi:formylglycine-generating enzyme required for sulfatase activity
MRAVSLLGILLSGLWCAPAPAQAPLSAAQEPTLKAGDVFRECPGCPEMVAIPAGAFDMGSPEIEKTVSTMRVRCIA